MKKNGVEERRKADRRGVKRGGSISPGIRRNAIGWGRRKKSLGLSGILCGILSRVPWKTPKYGRTCQQVLGRMVIFTTGGAHPRQGPWASPEAPGAALGMEEAE